MPHEGRKVVTVIFADVTGSTSMGEHLDPEALRHVMARYAEEMRSVLERHGGTVEKFIGDAVVAVFGIPLVHEDDALRAVRAAAEMRAALARLNEELERERGVAIAVRTGINTGEVVAGDPSAGESFATGDAVNVAARLEQAAEPGEILLGAPTFRLVREAVRAEAVEPLSLKGKAAAVPAWRLLGVVEDGSAAARRFDSPLVGRRDELAQLGAAYERALAGRTPVLLTVVGEAGVGKSRLSSELIARIESEARVLVGRCLSYGEGITYWPLVGIVERLEHEAPLAELLAHTEDGKLIAERVDAAIGRADAPGSAEETFWAVRKLVAALARARPLLIVVDDVHWAEPTFLDLLEHLADWVRDAPILLVCLARPEFLDGRPDWPGERIALSPLSETEAEALLEALSRDAGLAGETPRRIVEAAEGNPLFVEQMLAMLAEDGVSDEPLSLPPTIHALLAARIDLLPRDERAVLERASVVGKEFWHSALVSLSPETAEVTVPLQRLVRKHFILPGDSTFPGEDAFRFRHILIREAAYAMTSKELRAGLHERFADWLQAKSTEYDEIVGYHLEQAYGYGAELGRVDERGQALATRAGERLASAGRRALARSDMPATVNLMTRAASLLPRESHARLELLPDLGASLVEIGEFARADAVLSEAIELAAAAGNEGAEARARIERCNVTMLMYPEGASDDALREADRLIPVLERLHDDVGLAKAWLLRGLVDLDACRYGSMKEAMTRALVYARRAGAHMEAQTAVFWIAACVAVGPTRVDEGIRVCEKFLAEVGGDRIAEAGVRNALAWLHAMAGNFAEARSSATDARRSYAEFGMTVSHAATAISEATVEILAGDLAAAEEVLRFGIEALRATGERSYLSTLAACLADVLCSQERYDEADGFLRLSRETAGSTDLASQVQSRTAHARLLAARGDMAAAEAVVEEAISLAATTDDPTMRGDAFLARVEVMRRAERPADAAASAREALRLYEAKGNVVGAERARSRLDELTAAAPSE